MLDLVPKKLVYFSLPSVRIAEDTRTYLLVQGFRLNLWCFRRNFVTARRQVVGRYSQLFFMSVNWYHKRSKVKSSEVFL